MLIPHEFLTPSCTVFASRLLTPIPQTALYMLKVTFTKEHAEAIHREMREFLKAAFGALEGMRAADPLHDLGDGRWLLDLVSTTAPAIFDAEGNECAVARMPPGSLVRVRGSYRAMPFPKLMPIMSDIQIGRLAQDNVKRRFEPFNLAA